MFIGKYLVLVVVSGFLLVLSCTPVSGQSKSIAGKNTPYFRNPLGIPISLSANFGELRSTHWHMGLDIRTNRKVNYRVYAAADGYIARAGIQPLGFGRFLVINHPNGLSTLYAHLNSFFPVLEEYVNARQKERESWSVELLMAEGQFPVKKGDIIALSGTTGSSNGPHLHFEIRDTKSGKSINNLFYGFEVVDKVPPVISSLAVYNREHSTYQGEPQLFRVSKVGNIYTIRPGTIVTGNRRLSFAIRAFDRVSGSANPHGIYSANLFLDGEPQIGFRLDTLSYDESSYVSAHIDKKYRNAGGIYLQHLSRLPGYKGPVYHDFAGNGVITVHDTMLHAVRIEVADADGNKSELKFNFRYRKPASGNTSTAWKRKLIPGQVNFIEERKFEVFMPEGCLYDTLPVEYSSENSTTGEAVSSKHDFLDPEYPVHLPFVVRIKPEKVIPDSLRDKIIIARNDNKDESVRKAVWRDDWLTAEFDEFGIFQAFIDSTPPLLNPPFEEKDTADLSSLTRLVFTPKDRSGISSFRAELDGRWLMFSNDKAKSFVYIFDEQCPYGLHELKISVRDRSGNLTEKSWWFRRDPYTPSRKRSR